jgi:hypothetical protein
MHLCQADFQVGKNLLNNRWVFSAIAPGIALPPTSLWSNAGDNLQLTTAFALGLFPMLHILFSLLA